MDELQRQYPWTRGPLISCAPMRLIALAPLVVEVTRAGGLGFIGAGSDVSTLAEIFADARRRLSALPSPPRTAHDTLPIGVGFLLWGAPLDDVVSLFSETSNRPAAAWLFAPRQPEDLKTWTDAIRKATDNTTQIWIQVGTVADALHATVTCHPDVLVVQGQDAGGHGLTKGASLMPLLPETIAAVESLTAAKQIDTPSFVAAGAITTGTNVAAAITLGAAGVCMGTRFLACPEANIAPGYRNAVLRAKDGGATTMRTDVYDTLRGTTDWPPGYGGRGVINASFHDSLKGMSVEDNKKLYEAALKKGDGGWDEADGRLTTYAGTGVGLLTSVKDAAEIVDEVREDAKRVLKSAAERVANLSAVSLSEL